MNLEYYAINRQSSHLERCCELAVPGRSRCGTHGILCNIQAKTADERLTDQHRGCFVKKGIVCLYSIHTLEENSCLDYI